jgi:hypothetical protein
VAGAQLALGGGEAGGECGGAGEGLVDDAIAFGELLERGELLLAGVSVEVEEEANVGEVDGCVAVDAEGAAEVEVALGADAPGGDGDLKRGGDGVEGDAGAGDEGLQQVSMSPTVSIWPTVTCRGPRSEDPDAAWPKLAQQASRTPILTTKAANGTPMLRRLLECLAQAQSRYVIQRPHPLSLAPPISGDISEDGARAGLPSVNVYGCDDCPSRGGVSGGRTLTLTRAQPPLCLSRSE